MKKIGLWMAALTAVTVGGVYASFYYSQDVAGINEDKNRSIQITGTSNSGSAGSYFIDTTTLIAQIDSAEQYRKDITDLNNTYLDEIYGGGTADGFAALDNHTALLNITGYVTITFTPTTNAEQTLQENGIETKVDFSVNGDASSWSYVYDDPTTTEVENTPISILDAINNTIGDFTIYPVGYSTDEGVAMWTKKTDSNGKDYFEYQIQASSIYNNEKQLIKLKPTVLDTVAHHTAYKTAISGKEITVEVSSVGVNPAPETPDTQE